MVLPTRGGDGRPQGVRLWATLRPRRGCIRSQLSYVHKRLHSAQYLSKDKGAVFPLKTGASVFVPGAAWSPDQSLKSGAWHWPQ